MLDAAKVAGALGSTMVELPTTGRQARELARRRYKTRYIRLHGGYMDKKQQKAGQKNHPSC